MRYMLLIYHDEKVKENQTAEERIQSESHAYSYIEETQRRGVFQAADPLEPTRTATTVRTQNGKVTVTDGPFAETKEQLAGYFILDCKDLDEALEWAAKFPMDCAGGAGSVEVRPLRDLPRKAD
ncbi:MAG TPA: YciI family protein [Terriglobia bacterium]|nr:YciI family protein [Terriglobia bacterium]